MSVEATASMREQVAEYYRALWGYAEHNDQTWQAADRAMEALAPVLEAGDAEVERLRERVHTAVDETQRRYASYQSRCHRFDVWSKWAREAYERHGGLWGMESEATRLVVQSLLGERDALSGLLRGMARRVGEWRRTSAGHYAEFYQTVEDWGRNDEQVLADSAVLAEKTEWLSEACRLTVREAAAVRSERDRLLRDATPAREKLMELVGGDWTVEPSLNDLATYAARFWSDDRKELERLRAEVSRHALEKTLAAGTSAKDGVDRG